MKKVCLSFLLIGILVLPRCVMAGSGWFIFYERSFTGRVVDEETGEPIKQAVVLAIYNVYKFGPIEGSISVTDVKETLTSDKGEFFFPSLVGFIAPWSVGDDTFFLIWKPGYQEKFITQSWLFTKESGTIENRPIQTDRGFETKPVRFGIVELQPAKTMDDRRKVLVSPVENVWCWKKKQKKFIEMLRKEHEYITGKPAGNLYK
jgi:hypothetical protein